MRRASESFEYRTLDQLAIDDRASFRHVALYADLEDVLRRARYRFRVLPRTRTSRWDRALLLNLTYWSPEAGGDVLVGERVAADVVAHVAWHHLAAKALAKKGARPSVDALFLGEAIASAFDVYLVGRLLGRAPRSTFLETQVPAMVSAAEAAGTTKRGCERMLRAIAEDPARAFADLRELLSTAAAALFASDGAAAGLAALSALDAHRFAPLLHRYELSNWVLYARAYGDRRVDREARRIDRALRRAPDALEWLTNAWVAPAVE